MSIIRLDDLLTTAPGKPLAKLVQRAKNMTELTVRLRAALSDEASAHLIAANVRDDGELVLVCSSPSWAARLRFESEALLGAAARAGVKADRLRVRVATGR